MLTLKLKQILPSIYELIKLAREVNRTSEKIYKKYGIEDGFELGDPRGWDIFNDKELRAKEKELEDYLEKFSKDEVILIESLMYIGRDGLGEDPRDTEGILQNNFNYFSDWTKDDAINQMTEKFPLPDYLENGIKILNLE